MRSRLVALVAVFGVFVPVASGASPSVAALQAKLTKALRVPHVSAARSAGIAVDLSTGNVLFAQNGTRPLAPASNEKLPVTFAALSVLGPAYHFETDVLGSGTQTDLVWDGTLILEGSGDPTLSSARLRSLAMQIRAGGIRRVTGGIVADESWFDSRRTVTGWKPSFYLDESPPLSALVVDRDRVNGYLSTDPALAAGNAFRTALRAAGISVAGTVRVGIGDEFATPLASTYSPPLSAIVGFMDRESDNFTAEMLLKQLGAVQLDRGTSAAGAAVVMQTMAKAGVPMTGVRIVDGSGLSLLDRLTAGSLAALLRAAWNDPTMRPVLLASLPVAGISGTLHDRMRRGPARGNVLAKTGTTNEASALSGYVRNRYVFAVIQNGYPLSYWWARVAQDRFAQVLAAQ